MTRTMTGRMTRHPTHRHHASNPLIDLASRRTTMSASIRIQGSGFRTTSGRVPTICYTPNYATATYYSEAHGSRTTSSARERSGTSTGAQAGWCGFYRQPTVNTNTSALGRSFTPRICASKRIMQHPYRNRLLYIWEVLSEGVFGIHFYIWNDAHDLNIPPHSYVCTCWGWRFPYRVTLLRSGGVRRGDLLTLKVFCWLWERRRMFFSSWGAQVCDAHDSG